MTSSTVPVLSDFSSEQRQIFQDGNNNETYFHYMSFDSKNGSRIYIGGLDYVYRLYANNISVGVEKSPNITKHANYTTFYENSIASCRQPYTQKSRPDYQCRNHIRGILPATGGTELYICGTGAYRPQDFYLDVTNLEVTYVGNTYQNDPSGSGSGISKCPYDPDTNHTIIYVDEDRNNPYNKSAIYSSLLAGENFYYNIYRSAVQQNRFSPILKFPLHNDQGPALGELSYIASFEIDQYVYFFFRELAAEFSSCGTMNYPRVARVCKSDEGGQIDNTRFLTYVKARLNCSVGTNVVPVYYNELYDIQYDADNKTFYGLFMGNDNGQWGSAICRYSYADISSKFDSGQFYAQETAVSQWTVTPDNQVPKPRPSSCVVTSTLSTTAQSFALSHLQMAGTINQMTRIPLYCSKYAESYNRFIVDIVQGKYTVFYLYSASAPDSITRKVQWIDALGNIQSRDFSILKPFKSIAVSPLWDMKLHSVGGTKWIYLVTDMAVVQLSTQQCSQYGLCTDCARDPYCGWDPLSMSCLAFTSNRPELIQAIESSSPLSSCSASCIKPIANPTSRTIPGTAVHMKCSSFCSPDGVITWSHEQMPINVTDENFVFTKDGGLIILNVTRDHNGTFECISNNVVLARYPLSLSACTYGDDVQNIWMTEYRNWCTAFDSYQKDYKQWTCLKDNCIAYKNNCNCTSGC